MCFRKLCCCVSAVISYQVYFTDVFLKYSLCIHLLVVSCQMCCRNVLCVFASSSSQLCTCFRNILCVSAGSQCVHVSEMYFVYLLVVSCPCVSEMYLVYQLSINVYQICTLCISCPCVLERYPVYQLSMCFRNVLWCINCPCVSEMYLGVLIVPVFQKCT